MNVETNNYIASSICFPKPYRMVSFDEKRRSDTTKVKKILVLSKNININFYVASTDTVEASFHGEAVTRGRLEFSLDTRQEKCIIKVDIKGGSYKGRKLQLDVLLPKKEFELIAVVTDFSHVSVNEGVKAKMIDVESKMEDFLASIRKS